MSKGTKGTRGPGGPGTYDEIARRHRGDRPAAARVAGRRVGTTTPAADDGQVTDGPPEDITAGAIEVGRARAGLGVPGVDGDGLRGLAARIDGNVGYVTPIVVGLVGAFPQVGATAGETPDGLAEGLRQRTEMLGLAGTASQLRADVTDTRRGTGNDLREDMKAIVAEIRAQLRPGARPKQEQDRLRSDSMELMTAWEAVEREPAAERERTASEDRAHEEALGEETARTELVRTMLALQSGEVVDQAEWDRAAASYDALGGAGGLTEATNRRARGR